MTGLVPMDGQDPERELLRVVRALDSVDIAFSATVDRDRRTFVLDRFDGARSGTLNGVVSGFGEGLGGRCIGLGRPVVVQDYARAQGISHLYDAQVAGEGLRAVLAVPVMWAGRVERVVYAGARRSAGLSGRLVEQVVKAIARHRAVAVEPPPAVDAPALVLGAAELRMLRAEIRAIAAAADGEQRGRLLALLDLLQASGPGAPDITALSRRENDVLALVAVGYGNGEVAEVLGLSLYTVKSYLKSAMAKLDSHTRGEAVHRARSAGILP